MAGPITSTRGPRGQGSVLGAWRSFPPARVPIAVAVVVLAAIVFATGRGLLNEVRLDTSGVPAMATVTASTSLYRGGQDTVVRFTPQGRTAQVSAHVNTYYVEEPPYGRPIRIEYAPSDPSLVRMQGDHVAGIVWAVVAALLILVVLLTRAYRRRMA